MYSILLKNYLYNSCCGERVLDLLRRTEKKKTQLMSRRGETIVSSGCTLHNLVDCNVVGSSLRISNAKNCIITGSSCSLKDVYDCIITGSSHLLTDARNCTVTGSSCKFSGTCTGTTYNGNVLSEPGCGNRVWSSSSSPPPPPPSTFPPQCKRAWMENNVGKRAWMENNVGKRAWMENNVVRGFGVAGSRSSVFSMPNAVYTTSDGRPEMERRGLKQVRGRAILDSDASRKGMTVNGGSVVVTTTTTTTTVENGNTSSNETRAIDLDEEVYSPLSSLATASSSSSSVRARIAPEVPVADPAEAQVGEGEKACSVCLERKAQVLAVPCSHLDLCIHCAREIVQRQGVNTVCVVCRSFVTKFTRVYL
jgi:hypothetical protein